MTDEPYAPSKVVLVVAGEKIEDFSSEVVLTIDPPPFKKWEIITETFATTTLKVFVKEFEGTTAWTTVVFWNDSPGLKLILNTDPYEFEGLTIILPEDTEYVLI